MHHTAPVHASVSRRCVNLSLTSLAIALVLIAAPIASAANNGVGFTPAMGWNSWKTFGKSYNQTIVEAQTNALLAQIPGQPSGTTLASLGYVYLAMDSGWRDESGTDGNGFAKPSLSKFPSGIPGIASYVHSKGLKIGIYLTPGLLKAGYDGNYPIAGTLNPATGKPYTTQDIVVLPLTNGDTENSSGASYSYQLDFTKPATAQWLQNYANMLASWGVDYIMFDFVGPGGGNIPANDIATMEHWLTALEATGRLIWIKLSNSLSIADASIWEEVSNSFRIDGDVGGTWTDVTNRMKDSPPWHPFEGRSSDGGAWGDMDSVLVGQARWYASTDERRSVVTLWSICCSPLILGEDLTKLVSGDIPLITNPEVIAVDQAGIIALPIPKEPAGVSVWQANNPDGSFVDAPFNTSGATLPGITITFSGTVAIRDLWARTDLGTFNGSFNTGPINSHACRLLKLTPVGAAQPAAAPVFAPSGGTFTTAPNVTITSATSSANIRYTTDGSTPSETAGTIYSGPVNISTSPTTLQAIAYKAGFIDSTVTSAIYTISTGGGSTFNFEAASMSPVGTGATVSTSSDPNVTGGLLEFLNSTAVGQSMTLTTPSIPAGTYQVQFRYKTNTSRAQHNVVIDGTQVGGTIDQYATTSSYPTATLGNVTFASAGTHTIVLTVTGKDSAATHFYITADKFTFVGQ